MTEIHWTEIDHVATVWADVPGPLRAGLLFRTGRADETFTTAGYTHLIEHLALSSIDDPAHHNNGFVGGIVTGLVTVGHPEDVCEFFARACASLRSFPGERLEKEKQILAAENATRQYDFRTNLLTWRYGAAGYGLTGLPELGLRNASLEKLQEFSAQKFTKGNAVLWLSGQPPQGLKIDLPDGPKIPTRPLAPVLKELPCWFIDDNCGGVAVSTIVPRVSASTLFCDMAANRLREYLRQTKSVSYSPVVFYDHLDAETAHMVLYADSDKEHRPELVNLFGEVLRSLEQIKDDEIEKSKRQITEHWVGPLAPSKADLQMIETQRAANDWIFGSEHESLERLSEEMQAVTQADIVDFWFTAKQTTTVALPSNVVLQDWMGKQLSLSKGTLVEGQKFASLDAPVNKEVLIYSNDGVSLVFPNGTHRTVRFNDMAAVVHFEDGCLHLVRSDASAIIFEPTLWRDGATIAHKILQKVPSHLIVKQQARLEKDIPKPQTTQWQKVRAWVNQQFGL